MPITPFLNGERFDEETRRILGVALEMSCIALRVGDCADDVRQAIANKIIALAKAGERNPDTLCERALQDTRAASRSGRRPAEIFPSAVARRSKLKRLIAGVLIVCVTIVRVAVAVTRHVAHKQAVEWCHGNGYANYVTTDGFWVEAGGN